MLLTVATGAHTATCTSSVPRVDAPSQWTVLEDGEHMDLVTTMRRTMRWRDAEYSRSKHHPNTMDMGVLIPMERNTVQSQDVASQ